MDDIYENKGGSNKNKPCKEDWKALEGEKGRINFEKKILRPWKEPKS